MAGVCISEMTKYRYVLMTMEDVSQGDVVFVPPEGTDIFQMFRFFVGWRKDFPAYWDGRHVVVGTDLHDFDDDFIDARIHKDNRCPATQPCILRVRIND